jgi:hypothetical protein
VARMGEKELNEKFWWGNFKEKVYFEGLGVTGKIILTVIGQMSCETRQRFFFQLYQEQRRARVDTVLDSVSRRFYLSSCYLMGHF